MFIVSVCISFSQFIFVHNMSWLYHHKLCIRLACNVIFRFYFTSYFKIPIIGYI